VVAQMSGRMTQGVLQCSHAESCHQLINTVARLETIYGIYYASIALADQAVRTQEFLNCHIFLVRQQWSIEHSPFPVTT
jgi:hypothetical protein